MGTIKPRADKPMGADFLDRIINAAGDFIDPRKGLANQAEKQIGKHMKDLDDINKQLDNTATQDTQNTSRIFEKKERPIFED